jgi:hypothetical protein
MHEEILALRRYFPRRLAAATLRRYAAFTAKNFSSLLINGSRKLAFLIANFLPKTSFFLERFSFRTTNNSLGKFLQITIFQLGALLFS